MWCWEGLCRVGVKSRGNWGVDVLNRERDLGTNLASKMADDGFQVVKKRKGSKCRNHKEKNGSYGTGLWISRTSNETITCDVNELRTKIEKCRHEKGLLCYKFKLNNVCHLIKF